MNLFEPLRVGALTLPNRIVMAPLTRARAGRSHVANALIAEHYAQRASAGLLIAEATMVSPTASAFTGEPGIYSDATVAGWKLVTEAVHAKGGRIVLQIWHPGRAAHSLLDGGLQPVSSTDRAIQGSQISTPEGKRDYETPRRLRDEELAGIVEQFRLATRNAMAAGFDGVQIHGAHGYLIDQFLRDGVNDREGAYGGSIEKRARLLLEVVDAATQEAGADRVSVRISPLVGFNDLADSDPQGLVAYVATELNRRAIAFLELRHADHRLPEEQAIAHVARQHFKGVILRNGGYDGDSAQVDLATGQADAIVFGKAFISNPDLVERLRVGAPLAPVNFELLYAPGAAGYTDYPPLATRSA